MNLSQTRTVVIAYDTSMVFIICIKYLFSLKLILTDGGIVVPPQVSDHACRVMPDGVQELPFKFQHLPIRMSFTLSPLSFDGKIS